MSDKPILEEVRFLKANPLYAYIHVYNGKETTMTFQNLNPESHLSNSLF